LFITLVLQEKPNCPRTSNILDKLQLQPPRLKLMHGCTGPQYPKKVQDIPIHE
jgi:hypothetical protein